MKFKYKDILANITNPKVFDMSKTFEEWLDTVLNLIYILGAIIGLPIYLIGINFVSEFSEVEIVLIKSISYLWIVCNVLIYRFKYKIRAIGLILMLLLIGSFQTIYLGPFDPGPLWLFSATLAAGILFGYRASMYLIIFHFLLFLILSYYISINAFEWVSLLDYNNKHWFLMVSNFLLLNFLSSFLLASIHSSLKVYLIKEKNYRQELESERDNLKIANDLLISEMKEREILEKELILSEERMKFGQDVGRIGNWELNPSTGEFWASEKVYEMLGIDSDNNNFDYDLIQEMIYNEDFYKYTEQLHKTITDGKKFDLIFRIINQKTYEIMWVHGIASKSYHQYSDKSVVIGVIQDVSEQMLSEQELRRSIVKYSTLYERAHDSILIMDEDIFIDCNNKTLELFDYDKKEDIIYSRPYILSPEYQSNGESSETLAKKYIAKALKGGHVFFEWIHKKKSGELFDAEVSLNRLKLDGNFRLIAFVRDISNRKTIERKLIESESRQKLALEASSVGLYEWDFQSNIMYFSKEYMQMLGYEHYELEHSYQLWLSLIHGEDRDSSIDIINQAIESNTDKFELEFRMRCKDGSYKWILSRGSVISRELGGIPKKILGTHTDIDLRKNYERKILRLNQELEEKVSERTFELNNTLTKLKSEIEERKLAEEDLSKAKKELEVAFMREKELNDLKMRFISMISHEYRSPLTVIMSSTYILELLFEKRDKTEFLKNLYSIQNSVKSMTNLLENVLSIGNKNGLEITKSEINVITILNSIINENIINDNSNRNIELITEEKALRIITDRGLFVNIINQLIGNAIKFSPAEKPIIVNLIEFENHIQINIIDEGIGIPRDDQYLIYEPFHRGKNIGAIEGRGLGLTIVKHHIRTLNSTISFHSEVDKGTTFELKFPKQI